MKVLKDKRILILLISFFAVILIYLLQQPDLHHGNSEDFQAWAKEDIQDWLDKNYVGVFHRFPASASRANVRGLEPFSI